MGTDK